MRTAGRLLLLFILPWAAFWGTPSSQANQESLAAWITSPQAGAVVRPAFELPTMHVEVAEAASETFPSEALGRFPARAAAPVPPNGGWSASARLCTTPFRSPDILLLIQRQNE